MLLQHKCKNFEEILEIKKLSSSKAYFDDRCKKYSRDKSFDARNEG